jgi:lysyl-tRNA synthetase class 2
MSGPRATQKNGRLARGRALRPRVERHTLGPRIYFLGLRWHEWHLGILILLGLALGIALGLVNDPLPSLLGAAAGAWLVAKDWRDISTSRRDTAAWRLGLHRPPLPLRNLSRAEPLPLLVALATTAFAAVNLLSALTPTIRWRGHFLLKIEPLEELHIFHALAIPASIALFVSAYYLYRRRLRALQLAVLLLLALSVLNLFKGLDFEEASGDVAAAAFLWAGRRAFYVRHEPISLRAAALRAPLVVAAGLSISLALVEIAAPATASTSTLLRETWALLLWQPGPLRFHDEVARIDLAIGLLGIATLATAAYLLFRPIAAPRDLPDAEVRAAARELVSAHGSDTLAYFKLRRDKHYLFTGDRSAFLGYRVENRVLVVSGDPVGPPEAIPELLAKLAAFADERGLMIAALGVSEQLRPRFEQLGLRAFYMGDEAIIETNRFSLEGRPIRKVRQSVTRLQKAGFTAQLSAIADLDQTAFAGLERVSRAWRGKRGERGFSMALDALHREDQHDTLVLVARDPGGDVRGFLHFVPSYGRAAVSLSFMRRDPQTPNGLTEFMVAKAIETLRTRGVEEISLNFAAFARLLDNPERRLQRLLGRALGWADAVFQIERLYRFNAKFFPRWEPRYLMHEGLLALPRVALAALWLEGQIPKPRLRGRTRPDDQHP